MSADVAPTAWSLPLMVGLPDDSRVPLLSDGTRLFWIVPGNASFPAQLAPPFRHRLRQVFFGPDIHLSPSPATYGKPVVNNISDPDTSAVSLQLLAAMLERIDAGCFNRPQAIVDSARDRAAAKLAGIAGLHVPRVAKLRIDEPADLLHAIEQLGLQFPLIVRLSGEHNGDTMVRIDDAHAVRGALKQIPWGGHDIYVTEYVDFHDADGRYRKLRLVVVGRDYFIRHLIVADEWNIHAQHRDAAAAAEEIAFLEAFHHDVLPHIRGTLDAVANAMDLDYFGIDCSLRPGGRLLLFEANASMNILHNSAPSPNCWDAPIERIREALAMLLFDPARWRHPSRELAPA